MAKVLDKQILSINRVYKASLVFNKMIKSAVASENSGLTRHEAGKRVRTLDVIHKVIVYSQPSLNPFIS